MRRDLIDAKLKRMPNGRYRVLVNPRELASALGSSRMKIQKQVLSHDRWGNPVLTVTAADDQKTSTISGDPDDVIRLAGQLWGAWGIVRES